MKNTFGANLSILRKHAGLSQEALAERLGVSRQAVSNWERNLSEPDVNTINLLSELLNVTVSDLLESPTSNSFSGVPHIKPTLTIISVVMASVHLVLGVCNLVNVTAVVALPIMCAFILSTIYIAFTMMIKSNNYDMLAGFDSKKDSIKATQLQMYWAAILSGLTSVLFEVLFILIYFTPKDKQMVITTIMAFSYYAAEVICCIAISIKIKSRK